MKPTKLRALGVTSGVGSMLIGAKQAGFDIIGNIEWRNYYRLKDVEGRNTFTENFPGAFLVAKYSDLNDAQQSSVRGVDLVFGHPESFRPWAPVYTPRGWVPIRKILVGDLVLTHRGRFRRVYRIIHYGAPNGTEEVTLSRNSRVSGRSLVVTANHPLLMEDGTWRKAGEIRSGDRLVHLVTECPRCGELAPIHYMDDHRVSCGCTTRRQWRRMTVEERAEQIVDAHKETRKLVRSGKHPFNDEIVRQKGQLVQARSSKLEEQFLGLLEERCVSVERQHPVGSFFVDFAVPELKIAIEIHGGNWHQIIQKRSQDENKRRCLEREGWTILVTPPRPDRWRGGELEILADEVSRLAANHREEYQFAAFPMMSVRRRIMQPGEQLCNLGVEDDETYIVKSFVTHNCGGYSAMNALNARRTGYANKMHDPGDIPLFIDTIAKVQPRYFAMDDLPKSLIAFSMAEYARRLPEYDLFPEWVSNYGYGNIQLNRRRMFVIGALKTENFVFAPGETFHDATLENTIGDLWHQEGNVPNHDPHAINAPCGPGKGMDSLDHRPSWRDMQKWFSSVREGTLFRYHSPVGGIKVKPGWAKSYWKGHSYVLDGGSGHMHPIRNLPFSIRERARIQGFPDDFLFYGTKLDRRGRWIHDKNNHMVKQTGKAMPIQFCTYLAKQIAAHIKGKNFDRSNERLLKPNTYIDQAKTWWCTNENYADQPSACEACWMKVTCPMSLSMSKQLLKEMKEDETHLREGKIPRKETAETPTRSQSSKDSHTKLQRRVVEIAKDQHFEEAEKTW